MFKCKMCGKEFANKRAVHAHLLTTHGAEYRAAGMKQEQFIEGVEQEPPKDSKRPDGFRYLSRSNEAEAAARAAGYDFVDNYENLYTIEDAKKRGWL